MPTVTQLSTRSLWAGFTYSMYLHHLTFLSHKWHHDMLSGHCKSGDMWFLTIFVTRVWSFLLETGRSEPNPQLLIPEKNEEADLTWPDHVSQSWQKKNSVWFKVLNGWILNQSIGESWDTWMETSECLVGCLCHLQTIFVRKLRGRFEHIFSTNACCRLVG